MVVEVHKGAMSVLLPCHFTSLLPDNPVVTWRRYDFNPQTVHLRQGEDDNLKDQNLQYSERTSMMVDALDTRDFSLNLKKPQLSDSGSYTCSISNGREELKLADVLLKVKGQQHTR